MQKYTIGYFKAFIDECFVVLDLVSSDVSLKDSKRMLVYSLQTIAVKVRWQAVIYCSRVG